MNINVSTSNSPLETAISGLHWILLSATSDKWVTYTQKPLSDVFFLHICCYYLSSSVHVGQLTNPGWTKVRKDSVQVWALCSGFRLYRIPYTIQRPLKAASKLGKGGWSFLHSILQWPQSLWLDEGASGQRGSTKEYKMDMRECSCVETLPPVRYFPHVKWHSMFMISAAPALLSEN